MTNTCETRDREASSLITRPALIVFPRPTSSASRVTGNPTKGYQVGDLVMEWCEPILPSRCRFEIMRAFNDNRIGKIPLESSAINSQLVRRRCAPEHFLMKIGDFHHPLEPYPLNSKMHHSDYRNKIKKRYPYERLARRVWSRHRPPLQNFRGTGCVRSWGKSRSAY
jgi:hypothetical protein